MLGKAIRKAVLPILLASLMVGTGCRIVYGKADISLNERAENFTSDNTAASPEEQEKTTEPAAPDDALVQAPSALLMEASTGTVIYEKDSDTRRSPASITKIMTLILIFDALENGTLKMDDLVTTSAYAKSMGGSQVFLEEGETQDVETMIKCIVIASGNDASVAMAEHIGGSEQEFVRQMNERAAGLGMENTHFCDSTGLHNPDHYSTVKDIAVLMKYCIKNDTFREIVETSRHSTGVTNIHPDGITYYSTMFKNLSDPTVTGGKILGGKTGYTSEAGHCLVSFAEIEGREYIFVSAGASGADGNTIPHIQDAVTVYNRVGAAVEAKMNDNNK